MEGNKEKSYLLLVFGAVIISLIVASLFRWVIRPLHRLGQSLETGRSEALAGLQHTYDEFGDLARQVAHSFLQQDALRESQVRLHQAVELRGRLARDLHDGIIQSIYAVGLGLEAVRNLQATNPAESDQRLAACQQMLNDSLCQLRNFIEALEPEEQRAHNLAQSLTTLAATMRSLQPIAISADTDPNLDGQISAHQEMHLLQMAREAVSNAVRHSDARHVRISLRSAPGGLAVLKVADDGNGFDPALRTDTGRGLLNLASRAREIGAELRA